MKKKISFSIDLTERMGIHRSDRFGSSYRKQKKKQSEHTFCYCAPRGGGKGGRKRRLPLELTTEDIDKVDNLIRAMVSITCRKWGLRREQVSEDMIQDCWVEVLRVKDRYDPTRASLITFLYLSITRVCGRSAQKIKKRGIAEFSIDERHALLEATDRIESLEVLASADVRVAAAAMGFNDDEIAQMLGESVRETTKRRRAAARDLAVSA